MKKILTKFWGVAITLVLLSSLCIIAVPATPAAAADPLVWNPEIIPSTFGNTLTAGFTIWDMGLNGDTVYAVGQTAGDTANVYKSTNGGATWTLNDDANTLLGIVHTDMVAVAPDDPNIVVVIDNEAATNTAWATTTGGAIWSPLNLTAGIGIVRSVAISPAVFGQHYIAVATSGTASSYIYWFPLGAAAPTWSAANAIPFGGAGIPTSTSWWAVAFSPNFASDYIMLAVSANATGGLYLNAASFNSFRWNTDIGYFDGYPALIAGATATTKVTIAMSPDYAGGDDTLRTAFIGLDITPSSSAYTSGIVRMSDYIGKQLMASATPINSVDYNGSVLVAGQYDTNTAWFCTDPLDVTPTVAPARSLKRPGIDVGGTNEQVVVKWYGEKVVATVRGAMGAFSQSIDNGLTWADVSLENFTLSDITDVYVAGDASKWYFAANNGADSAVYRYDGTWLRELNLPGALTLILRAAMDSPDALYVASQTATALYFTADAGETRWYNRTAPGNVVDLAAESADVVYVGYGNTVKKSTNQGFTWGAPTYPLSLGNVYSLYSVSANNLIVGSDAGTVAYSTDGGATYTRIVPPIGAGATNVMAVADKLDAGGNIYATSTAGLAVSRYVIGTDTNWRDLAAPTMYLVGVTPTPIGGTNTGIALAKGVLYVSNTSAVFNVMRNTFPQAGTPSFVFWDLPPNGIANTAAIVADRAPWALKTSSASVKLWVANDVGGADSVYSYEDTLADTAPTVSAPADKAIIPLNPQSGYAYAVTFTWSRPSLATDYNIFVSLDPFLTQLALAPITTGFSTFDTNSYVLTGGSLVPGTQYYWAVKAVSPISSGFSQIRSFTIQPNAAQVPVIEVPVNGAILNTTTPAFSWTPVTGATSYDFQISELPGFETTTFTDTTSGAAEALPVTIKLDTGKTYFWRVRAAAPVQGDWSVVGTFSVATPPTSTSTSVPPPVTITQTSVTVTIPPATTTIITLPTTTPPAQIAPAYIWAIIVIGAILVIAVIVLIVRTRRSV